MTSYRQLRVKDMPEVPKWRLEVVSNQRPSASKAPNTIPQPTTPLTQPATPLGRGQMRSVMIKAVSHRLIQGVINRYVLKFAGYADIVALYSANCLEQFSCVTLTCS